MYSGKNVTEEELRRMMNEKIYGNDSRKKKEAPRKKHDRGELIQREDGVYRSKVDFPHLSR